MFIRKNQISSIIKKEKQKEKHACEKEFNEKLKRQKKMLVEQYEGRLSKAKIAAQEQIAEKDREIQRLVKEIERNHSLYQKIRQREKDIDQLSLEIDDVVHSMVIRVQESLQPFYRTRAKVVSTRKRSDRAHDKVESIFRNIK